MGLSVVCRACTRALVSALTSAAASTRAWGVSAPAHTAATGAGPAVASTPARASAGSG
jgi:hypothetical protein